MIKKTSVGAVKKDYSKWRISWIVYTNQLLQNLEKEKSTLIYTFIDNIWGTDLADMQLIS